MLETANGLTSPFISITKVKARFLSSGVYPTTAVPDETLSDHCPFPNRDLHNDIRLQYSVFPTHVCRITHIIRFACAMFVHTAK